MSIQIAPGAERFATRAEGRTTFHSFSFGAHFDPANVGFAAMTAHNDERLPAGTGYADHRHAEQEILTWVLDGALAHTDSVDPAAGRRILGPGSLVRTSAGTGVTHSELAAPGTGVRFLQTWLRPDAAGAPPSVAVADIGPLGSGLVELAGPRGAVALGVRGARFYAAAVGPGELTLPEAPWQHLFAVSGELAVGDRTLRGDDAARLRGEGGRRVTIAAPSLLALWTFDEPGGPLG